MKKGVTIQTCIIKINRVKSGILSNTPAMVLVDNKFVSFYPGEEKEFRLKPGMITLNINKSKYLTFDVADGEKKEFQIKEGIEDWNFLLKYGSLAILLLLILLLLGQRLMEGKDVVGGLLGIFFGLIAIRGIKKDYFYLEET